MSTHEKPCPFCGSVLLGIGRKSVDEVGENHRVSVYCGVCGAQGPWIYATFNGTRTDIAWACEATGWGKRADPPLVTKPTSLPDHRIKTLLDDLLDRVWQLEQDNAGRVWMQRRRAIRTAEREGQKRIADEINAKTDALIAAIAPLAASITSNRRELDAEVLRNKSKQLHDTLSEIVALMRDDGYGVLADESEIITRMRIQIDAIAGQADATQGKPETCF